MCINVNKIKIAHFFPFLLKLICFPNLAELLVSEHSKLVDIHQKVSLFALSCLTWPFGPARPCLMPNRFPSYLLLAYVSRAFSVAAWVFGIW